MMNVLVHAGTANSLTNLKIRTKLALGFGAVLMVTVALGLFAMLRLGIVNDAALEIRDNWLPSTVLVANLRSTVQNYRLSEARHVMATTVSDKDKIEADLMTFEQRINNLRAEYEPIVTEGEERGYISGFDRDWQDYLSSHKVLIDLSRSNETEKAGAFFRGPYFDSYRKTFKNLEDDVALNIREGRKAADSGSTSYESARIWIMGALFAAGVLCAVIGMVLAAGIARPIAAMTAAMRRLANRDMTAEIVGVGRRDEIGDMAGAVQVFKDSMIEADRLTAVQAAENEVRLKRSREIEAMIARFDGSVAGILRTVASAATELDSTAHSMAAISEESSRQASASAAAAEQTAANVQTVAAAAEEMTSSLQEISRQVSRSSGIASDAVNQAEQTDVTVRGLADAAQKINEVVELISTIAGQTNLLALNATIEAARAGEHGKGFAVVASEVKHLASQTGKATEEITAQITAIQAATGGAVTAIRGIGGTIRQMNEITTTISAAVEEQNAATAEISRSVGQAAAGTQEVSRNVGQVQQASSETGSAATQVLGAAGELSRQAEALRGEIEQFLSGIRAA